MVIHSSPYNYNHLKSQHMFQKIIFLLFSETPLEQGFVFNPLYQQFVELYVDLILGSA